MRIVVTGAEGFIGRNLCVRLAESAAHEVVGITRDTGAAQLREALSAADFVMHLAGVNRPKDPQEFVSGNATFTELIVTLLTDSGRATPVLYASSTQAALDNPYGHSKRAAEAALLRYGEATGAPVYLFRLPNVFGKWSRPHYNSAVATFCHLLARGQPITVHDPAAPLRLIYIDDAIDAFLHCLRSDAPKGPYVEAAPVYDTTVGDVVGTLREIAESRTSLITGRVGTGLTRGLYATFVSFLPPEEFVYQVPRYSDPRGVFVEMLKTPDCGQFSYFTAHPGITRGEHYHHTKTEKFLVIRGTARFGFRHRQTGETRELEVRGDEGRIVESVPGWTHNVTNIGDDELIIMLWANEIFDRARPDTVAMKVSM